MKDIYRDIFFGLNPSIREAQMNNFRQAILKLSEDQQKILSLHYELQLPVKDVAVKLNCSVTTVYKKLNSALYKLRKEFNPDYYKKAFAILNRQPETSNY